MAPEEIVKKLTEALVISDKTSVWNDGRDKENPSPIYAVSLMDDIIVDVIQALDPNWKRP